MDIVSSIFLGWLVVALFMAVLWVVQRVLTEADVVDAGWAASLGFLAIFFAVRGDGNYEARVLLALIAGIWSARLTWYLLVKRVFRPGEDGRYVELRAGWGPKAQRNFFIFFQAQGLLAVVLSIPFMVIAWDPSSAIGLQHVLAAVLAVVAIGGESIADAQLHAFRMSPHHQGKTCRDGLWRYSRHPNYFFEWMYWWSYVAMGIFAPWGILTMVSPVLMLYLILKITGIPPTEARALLSRGDDYRNYQRTTSAFFPWFPREAA